MYWDLSSSIRFSVAGGIFDETVKMPLPCKKKLAKKKRKKKKRRCTKSNNKDERKKKRNGEEITLILYR
jgi:hypothetical protein